MQRKEKIQNSWITARRILVTSSDELDAQIFLLNNRTNVYINQYIWYNIYMEKDIFNIDKNKLSYGREYVYSLQYWVSNQPPWPGGGTMPDGEFDWGGRLRKGIGGAQRFPQNGRKPFEECKGIEVDNIERRFINH